MARRERRGRPDAPQARGVRDARLPQGAAVDDAMGHEVDRKIGVGRGADRIEHDGEGSRVVGRPDLASE